MIVIVIPLFGAADAVEDVANCDGGDHTNDTQDDAHGEAPFALFFFYLGSDSRSDNRRDRSDNRRDRSDDGRDRSDDWRDRSDDWRDRSDNWRDRSDDGRDRSDDWRDRSDNWRDRSDDWRDRSDDRLADAHRPVQDALSLLSDCYARSVLGTATRALRSFGDLPIIARVLERSLELPAFRGF